MIISGGSRSNWRFFSKHLMRTDENERVVVTEIRGLASENVLGAFRELDALASGTQCKNFFYHCNINPREGETLTPEQWEQAVDTLERNLGLEGHSRIVVQHEKNGRTHQHVIWDRIDPDTMTAVSDSFTARVHERTSRELEETFGLEPVESILVKDRQTPRERTPQNWETFRGHRSGIDPRGVKVEVTELWQGADSGAAFAAALEERGYILAQGDRRDFCIIDQAGNEHSLARRIDGVKAAEVRARMADIDREALPSVEAARELVRLALERFEQERREQEKRPEPQDAIDAYADAVRQATGTQEPAPAWTGEERGTPAAPKNPARDDPMDAYAQPLEDAIEARGQIDMRDGMGFWDRTVHVFGQYREAAVTWAKDRWQSFVDYLDRRRDDDPSPENEPPPDDMGR